jgi:dTDP-glucose 4,6-dehydratase
MHLLVTGGAGFIGSNFVRREVENVGTWESITVIDALTYAGKLSHIKDLIDEEKIAFIHGNILDATLLDSEVEGKDVIVNFAAESHVDNSIKMPGVFAQTNVIGTVNLLEAAKRYKVLKYLQVSTDEVYGSIEKGNWDEESPVRPNSPYSASKASADLVCMSFFKTFGMDIRITRSSNNYGPRQYPEKLIPRFISLLSQKKKIPVYGDGSNIRDWLHVDDHCQGISRALSFGAPGEIYNLGGGRELTNMEMVNILLQIMNIGDEFIEFVEDRPGHDFRYSIDCSKAEKYLGYKPLVNFERGILDTVNWYQKNFSISGDTLI